jgi:hypothetical protein
MDRIGAIFSFRSCLALTTGRQKQPSGPVPDGTFFAGDSDREKAGCQGKTGHFNLLPTGKTRYFAAT